MHRPLILITEPIAEIGLTLLQTSCEIRALWIEGRSFNDADLSEASGLIVRLVPVTASTINKGNNLKVVGRHGVGLDTVDLVAATARRIPVVYTPLANANAVAEHTVHLMLSLARHTVEGDQAVRESHFSRRDSLIGIELRHRTLGIVGLGTVGLRVAEIGRKGFGMKIIGYDPYATSPHDFVTQVGSLRELLEQADVVSLHLPLTPKTYHLMNAESLGWMKPSAFLINTARGAIVDSLSLANALKNHRLAGAALDVFENEPLPSEHPLQRINNVLFSPHIGGSTHEAREVMAELIARQVLQVLKGECPEFLANPQVFGDGAPLNQVLTPQGLEP